MCSEEELGKEKGRWVESFGMRQQAGRGTTERLMSQNLRGKALSNKI